jgi:hypothetical protein
MTLSQLFGKPKNGISATNVPRSMIKASRDIPLEVGRGQHNAAPYFIIANKVCYTTSVHIRASATSNGNMAKSIQSKHTTS